MENLSVSPLETVISIIKEYQTAQKLDKSAIEFNKDISKQVYDSIFNWIVHNGTIREANNILDLLNKMEELDGFYTNTTLQALVAFTCLEALAREPQLVIKGSWEDVVLTIVQYSSELDSHCEDLIGLKKDICDKTTNSWILEMSCSPELCPNPCTRLEMFRFMRIFKIICIFPINLKDFRTSVISTLCELHDKHPTLKVGEVRMCTAVDLMYVIKISSLQIGNSVSPYYYPQSRRTETIAAIIKLSAMFAILEEERAVLNSERPVIEEERNNHDLHFQIENACLHFCGLIPDLNRDLPDLANAVCKSSLLQDYVADALRFISYTFPRLDNAKTAIEKRDRILCYLVIEEEHLRHQLRGMKLAQTSENRLAYFTKISKRDDTASDKWWRGDLCKFKTPRRIPRSDQYL